MTYQFSAERQLQEPLIRWLTASRRIGGGSQIFSEVPWFGRKVDLVTVSKSGCVVAYELKLNSFRRATEQSAFNRISFDRAYVVTASAPKEENLSLAAEAGVGVLLVQAGKIVEVCRSPLQRARKEIRARLLASLSETIAHVR